MTQVGALRRALAGGLTAPIPADEEGRLEALGRYDLSDTASKASLQELCSLAAEICQVPLAFVSLVEEEREVFAAAVGSEETDSPRGISFCGHAIVQTDELFVVPDTWADYRFAENPNVLGGAQIRFYAGTPLRTREGFALGALCVKDTVPRQLTPQQLSALAVLGRQVVVQLDHHRELANAHATTRSARRDRVLYQTLVERSTDLIALAELDGTISFASAAHETLLGYTPAELVGQNASLFADPTEVERVFEAVSAALAGDEPLIVRLKVRAKDGTIVHVESQLTLIIDDPAAPPLILLVSRDRSARVALEGQMRQAQKMETVGQLTGGIAHDFNNLLTPILGYSGLALGSPDLIDPELRNHVEQIKLAAEQGRTLIARLLRVSRPETPAASLLSIADIVDETLPLISVLLGTAVSLTVTHQAELPLCFADRGGLSRVLLNLAANARDALPEQNGEVQIETASVGDYVTLRFTDNGHGMNPETQTHIFEPFYSTKSDRGTGLGLSNVQSIISDADGTITVESAVDAGATFTISLPTAAEVPASG
jgi:PAS domain S-box-containing protein